MPEDLNHIQRLTGQPTYDLWSVQIKAVLMSKGVWEHVQGSVIEPIQDPDESSAAFRARQNLHQLAASKASGILQQSLSKSIVMGIRTITDAHQIWHALRTKYEPTGLAHALTLFQAWEQLRYNGTNLEAFSEKYTQACDRLAETALDVSAAVKMYRFVTIMTPWFGPFTSDLRAAFRKKTDVSQLPSLATVIAGLMDEQHARQTGEPANVGKPQRGKHGFKKGKKPASLDKCGHCQLQHAESKCWHLHPQNAPPTFTPRPCAKPDCQLTTRYAASLGATVIPTPKPALRPPPPTERLGGSPETRVRPPGREQHPQAGPRCEASPQGPLGVQSEARRWCRSCPAQGPLGR